MEKEFLYLFFILLSIALSLIAPGLLKNHIDKERFEHKYKEDIVKYNSDPTKGVSNSESRKRAYKRLTLKLTAIDITIVSFSLTLAFLLE